MLNSSRLATGIFLIFACTTCTQESAQPTNSPPKPAATPPSLPTEPPTRNEQPATTPSPLAAAAPVATPTPSPAPSSIPTSAPSPSTEMVYPKGWKGITIVANYAKTTVDFLGHFTTTRNACGLEEYGSLEITFWNEFATKMNQLVTAEWGTLAQCYEPPHTTRASMDGTVEVQLGTETKMAFEAKGYYEACSLLKDSVFAKDLLLLFNQIVLIADKEGCDHP